MAQTTIAYLEPRYAALDEIADALSQSPTEIEVYFCDPRSPLQRGSNETTNRLLRQYRATFPLAR